MSKIITAINVMVSNPTLLTDVHLGFHRGEVFFKYSEKHCWSITKIDNGDEYSLSYYPGSPDPETLADLPNIAVGLSDQQKVSYNTRELATREARDSFGELFSLVNEKAYGLDKVLEEIISSDELRF